jgi:hypothetical protein
MTENQMIRVASSRLSLGWRLWLVLMGYAIVVAILIVLMASVPWFDVTGSVGRNFGRSVTVCWCAALGVLLLGVVRRHNSQFTLGTLAVLTGAIAVYLGLSQTLHPVIPTMFVGAGLSIAMLYAAQRVGTDKQPFRGRICRVIMAVGGLPVLAHCVRVLGMFVLIQHGWIEMPAP